MAVECTAARLLSAAHICLSGSLIGSRFGNVLEFLCSVTVLVQQKNGFFEENFM